jgi:ABC-type antimicrobial peptide transport system permease subunit
VVIATPTGGDVRKVVLSYGLWRHLFTSETTALNQVLRLGGDPWWKLRDIRVNAILGRLKPGVLLSQAQSDMNQVTSQLAKQFPATNSGIHAQVEGLREAETGEFRGYITLVSASVLLLLAIGCFNIASFFVARASARQREFAIRGALGSATSDIIKQLLRESLLYGAIGGVLGIALAFLAIRGLTALLPADLPSWMTLRLDWRVLLFSIGLSAATAFVFGFAPLIGNARIDLSEALKQGGKGSSSANTVASQLRRGLMVAEVALSFAKRLRSRESESVLQGVSKSLRETDHTTGRRLSKRWR